MNNNALAIVVAFYLSKYDKEALTNLGFSSFNDAFERTAELLDVKRNYVKLRRDEFDPVYPWRQGWKRPMDKRIIRTIDILDGLQEEDIRDIVKNVLYQPSYRNGEEIQDLLNFIKNVSDDKSTAGKFILRCPTGTAAENYFREYHQSYGLPLKGALVDCRDLGCGYDYKIIESPSNEVYVEVKGMSDLTGGILFTNKEWKMALTYAEKYYLCIVKNLNNQAEVVLIKNPAQILQPQKSIRTIIQITWSVPDKELRTALNTAKDI